MSAIDYRSRWAKISSALKTSLAEAGQQVPILVRPTPEKEGRYQVAYGHRRVAALRALDRPVKAIVRELTDEELVVAQGKENNDRRDLSFIERALFAARLEDRGFPRTALVAALSLQKGNLSTMISVARSIPEELILAIGPAPKVGRPRWEQLAELAKKAEDNWREIIANSGFHSVDSDARFDRVLKALSPTQKAATTQALWTNDGKPVARVQYLKGETRLLIDSRLTPGIRCLPGRTTSRNLCGVQAPYGCMNASAATLIRKAP